MISKLLKFIIFSAVVLMLGQIPLKQSTVGELFLTQIKRAIDLGRGAAEHSQMLGSLGKVDWLKKVQAFFSVKPLPAEIVPPKPNDSLEMEEEPENFTPGDREAILKVLE